MIHTGADYNYYPLTNTVANILPYYLFETAEQDEDARAFMQGKVSEYVELASQFEKPLEKLLVIHDKMVENYKYDSSEILNDISYHAYGLFKNNTAVCQGYAQAYYMIVRELGIDIDFCTSESIQHMWNYVKLDGKWYHVDVTWDDPVLTDSVTKEIIEQTTAYHQNFLISDETRLQNEQGSYSDAVLDWETFLDELPECGKDFENNYLFNIALPYTISYDDEYFYAPCTYSDGQTISFRSRNLKSGILATSAPVPQNYGYTLYYYVLSDYSGNLNPIAVNSKKGQYSSFSKQNTILTEKDATYSIPIITDTSADITDIFIWDMNTLTPACEKISIR